MVCHNKKTGFTIVELLIVVVVIAILALIVIVKYTNVAQRATDAAIESDISTARTKLEQYQVLIGSGTYPVSSSDAQLALNTADSFTYNSISAGSDYCLYIKKGSYSGFVYGSSSQRNEGFCYSQCPSPKICGITTVTSAFTKDSQGNYYLLNYGSYIYNPDTGLNYTDVDLVKYNSEKKIT